MKTWAPVIVKWHSLVRPESDGVSRHHVYHGKDDSNAVVSLTSIGYRVSYDGMGWPLGTDNLQEALQRAELLLLWTDFEEAK